jgi:hypothetical protein
MKQLFAFFIAASLAIPTVHAQLANCATVGTDNNFLGIQTIRLWPGTPPGAKTPGIGTTPATRSEPCSDTPALTIFGPREGTGNGSAVIIFPGGAYLHLAGDLEGREVADWFTARGFYAFILSYRLSSNGYILPVPLIDARRAIQTIRARAADYHISPNRIVVIGFSAGGHLAALAGTQSVPGNLDAEDPIDRASSRPDYLVLGYPWLDAITKDTTAREVRSDSVRHQRHTPDVHLPDLCRQNGLSGSEHRVLPGSVEGGRSVGTARVRERRPRQRPRQKRSRARPVAQPARKLASRAGASHGRQDRHRR